MFEIERVRDRERKIGYSLHKGTETLVRDRERFEIEGVRDRESQLYLLNSASQKLMSINSPISGIRKLQPNGESKKNFKNAM